MFVLFVGVCLWPILKRFLSHLSGAAAVMELSRREVPLYVSVTDFHFAPFLSLSLSLSHEILLFHSFVSMLLWDLSFHSVCLPDDKTHL